MKGEFLRRIFIAPRITKKDIALTLIPTILWAIAVKARDTVIETHCVSTPCIQESIPAMDRFLFGMEDPRADQYSFYTQDGAVAVSLVAPVIWQSMLSMTRMSSIPAAAIAAGTDLVIVLQTFAWNGLVTESIRLMSQRPRPFVYADPARASMSANYTAFPSGHASGTAAAVGATLFMLAGRLAPLWFLSVFAAIGYSTIFATGVYRMMAGRHFMSDVIFGSLLGLTIAFIVALRHRKA